MIIRQGPGNHLGKQRFPNPAYSNSVKSQQERILKIFSQNHSLSTMQARNEYGILHPCGRIKELRQKGHQIETHWIKETDLNGVMHRIGLYVYKGSRQLTLRRWWLDGKFPIPVKLN